MQERLYALAAATHTRGRAARVWWAQTLMLAADFRLPSTLSAADKRAHVESLMAILGLTKVCITFWPTWHHVGRHHG